jgi:diguanylate cyclase (GGDEF)-like protein
MRLRTKIFLLALMAALLVGATTGSLFARSWQDIASAYALTELQARLNRTDSSEGFEGWELELGGEKSRWKTAPPADLGGAERALTAEIAQAVANTRLPEGCFEYASKAVPGRRFFLAFRARPADGITRVLGLESASLLDKLRPMALPFFGLLVAVMAAVAAATFAVSAALNRDYSMIERVLENIGAGRLKDLQLPKSKDPSIVSLSEGLTNLSRVLDAKDQQISQVSSLAFNDPMTGIPNYRAFVAYVDDLISTPPATGISYALAILDVDFFKKVNDNYGHTVGDFVLKQVARFLKETMRADPLKRPADFYARYGGEEFVIVLPDTKDEHAHVGPLRLLKKMKETKLHVPPEITESGQPLTISVTASFGLSLWQPGWTREQWVKEADQGLYVAKKSGRARVVRLHPTQSEWT